MSIVTLPVLLVSSVSETVATPLILELIDNDVTEEYSNEIESPDHVWRLDNKYYSADVRVHVLTDAEVLSINPDSVEAHIIHITEDEATGQCVERAGEGRGRGGAWARSHVRVLLADGAELGALQAWAAAQRAELVPRHERPVEPFADACGLERVRAALHAHAWSNLRRKDTRFSVPPPPLDVGESESGESSDSEPRERRAEAEETCAVERAEAFALALGALAAERAPAHAPRRERLQRAEDLLTAFCRALGLDPDSA